jgi:hypothetical protein
MTVGGRSVRREEDAFLPFSDDLPKGRYERRSSTKATTETEEGLASRDGRTDTVPLISPFSSFSASPNLLAASTKYVSLSSLFRHLTDPSPPVVLRHLARRILSRRQLARSSRRERLRLFRVERRRSHLPYHRQHRWNVARRVLQFGLWIGSCGAGT